MQAGQPTWLTWARELQAIAQTGLTYCRDPFDRQRYEQIRDLAAQIFAGHTDTPIDRIAGLFDAQSGYATPKVDVRGAVFRDDGRLLLVRERHDDRWALPGGWADVHQTPRENIEREVREESGFECRVRKLAAVWDRTRHGHPPQPFFAYKMFFLCALTGGAATPSIETSEIGFFAENELPPDISLGRVQPHQLARMFAHHRAPDLPTDVD